MCASLCVNVMCVDVCIEMCGVWRQEVAHLPSAQQVRTLFFLALALGRDKNMMAGWRGANLLSLFSLLLLLCAFH